MNLLSLGKLGPNENTLECNLVFVLFCIHQTCLSLTHSPEECLKSTICSDRQTQLSESLRISHPHERFCKSESSDYKYPEQSLKQTI